jgi:HEXXH motif-containing protein
VLAPLSPDALAEAAGRVSAALDLIATADPELAAEIAAIVRQIVLVRAAPGSERDFGGASSFHLWGAVFLNAHRHASRVAMAEGLVHEAAHLLLFGEAGGERVVENDDGERHVSPLRDDPRPLDGIAHATFVLARMAYFAERLLASGGLSASERQEAEAALDRNRTDYRDAAEAIGRHARLTEAGGRMLGAAATYMSGRS